MRVIDLSHPVTTGMPVYPGDPEVSITPALSVAEDTVAVAHLVLGSHSGTHLDAPSHSIEGGRTVDNIPLELLQGEALILRTRVGANHCITVADLDAELPERLPTIVCIATGWDQHFADQQAINHPFISLELAAELWERGGRVLGIDALSPDASSDPNSATLPVHELWLGRDGIIVENLTRLTELPAKVEVVLAPLRLAGVDGSPIRAMARITTDFADSSPLDG
ncbi:cyclase family protein [Leucobacter coleopterorum]|uniref:Cyclase family protein n=1 Tax=Leucobacter coleopterorum TaxID=2714933 RepID=A0ABX6JX77_9MICO|nr:cyclase family protein [Leucobacter coleopterorum]QIM18909.1 cyclase family protein [Leucobacter coleopterorum]